MLNAMVQRWVAIMLELAFSGALESRKVFSIADVHGDFEHFKLILTGLGVATFEEERAQWTGGDAILVSTGDSVDRGVYAKPIYLAFKELHAQAPDYGGEVINLCGNHELMNLQGDLRYVVGSEYKLYGGREERRMAWSAQGMHGEIRERYLAAAVRGGTLFVHGGLDPKIIGAYGSGAAAIDALNAEVKKLFEKEVVDFNHRLFGQRGPFWNRNFAESPDSVACQLVESTLDIVGAKRMVIGHTPQDDGITLRCIHPEHGPQIILADVFISRAYAYPGITNRPCGIEYDGDTIVSYCFSFSGHVERKVLHSGSQRHPEF